jgi:lysozyme
MITRRATDIARDFIARFEGFEATAYLCPAGVWTIGFGHTGDVQPGDVVDMEGALALLESDMTDAIECVDQFVDIDLDDGQVAALVSLVFNIGCGAFKGSTILKLLNANQLEAAAGQFKRWNKGGGKEIAGLSRRRLAEEKMFRGEF